MSFECSSVGANPPAEITLKMEDSDNTILDVDVEESTFVWSDDGWKTYSVATVHLMENVKSLTVSCTATNIFTKKKLTETKVIPANCKLIIFPGVCKLFDL